MAGVNNGTPARLPAGGNAAMLVSTSDDPARVDAAWTFLKFITSGIGAALVAETTGYVPPNKAANDLLGDFYSQNPNKLTAVEQLPLLADWFAYPGENGLANPFSPGYANQSARSGSCSTAVSLLGF